MTVCGTRTRTNDQQTNDLNPSKEHSMGEQTPIHCTFWDEKLCVVVMVVVAGGE
jgi:hypothetical protein